MRGRSICFRFQAPAFTNSYFGTIIAPYSTVNSKVWWSHESRQLIYAQTKRFLTDRAAHCCGDYFDDCRYCHSKISPSALASRPTRHLLWARCARSIPPRLRTHQLPSVGYSASLGALAGSSCASPTSTAACLIDATLAAATASTSAKSGYYFTYTASSTLGYALTGTPAKVGSTGVKQYIRRHGRHPFQQRRCCHFQ